jgi:hypothetical protein
LINLPSIPEMAVHSVSRYAKLFLSTYFISNAITAWVNNSADEPFAM